MAGENWVVLSRWQRSFQEKETTQKDPSKKSEENEENQR